MKRVSPRRMKTDSKVFRQHASWEPDFGAGTNVWRRLLPTKSLSENRLMSLRAARSWRRHLPWRAVPGSNLRMAKLLDQQGDYFGAIAPRNDIYPMENDFRIEIKTDAPPFRDDMLRT